jgi:DNA-binding CsgD family transcriptional regulator
LETFLTVSVRRFAFAYAGGIVIASILLLGGVALNFHSGIAIVLIVPWLALLFIMRQNPVIPKEDKANANQTPISRTFPFKLIFLIILFYIAGGLMFKLVETKYVFAGFFWISNISYMVVVILAGSAVYFIEELDLRLLYRPVLPMLAAGFILFPFLNENYAIISFLFLQAGFALFDMYTWLVIVYIARGYSRPLPVLGLGMFWITLAMFAGNLIFTILVALIPLNRPVDTLAIIAGLVTLLAVFVFQDKKETFGGWETSGDLSDDEIKTGLSETVPLIPAEENPMATFQQPVYQELIQSYDLTARETEILFLILKGRNNPFIREKLNISLNTLKFHLRNIYRKLAVNNRQELLSLFDKNAPEL